MQLCRTSTPVLPGALELTKHLLSTYRYSLLRANFLSFTPQKQSRVNAIFITMQKFLAAALQLCCLHAIGNLFCHRASCISGRERDGLKLSSAHLKSHGLSPEERPFCWDEAVICILADLPGTQDINTHTDRQGIWFPDVTGMVMKVPQGLSRGTCRWHLICTHILPVRV